ncbi:MAG TPA: class I SAM-dependent methyltransferase [Anaerolineae bacterium]|nr:class I SAM-dependent methyltransferase [Anaerolineae bacterium]
MAHQPAEIISRHHWWHTIELGPRLVTPGVWDIRHLPNQIPWPASLAGLRCLDIGTRDGFWAFEMERRGAGEVLAIDVDYAQMDTPYHLRERQSSLSHSQQPGETFNVLAEMLGSKATFKRLNIYDLKRAEVGQFDVIFVGYILHQLRDPLRALEIVRDVCRGCVIVLDEIMFFRSVFSREPLARFGARRDFSEWFYFNAAGLRRVVEFAGFGVAASSPFLYYRRGPGVKLSELSLWTILKYTLGRAACSLAVRGEVSPDHV